MRPVMRPVASLECDMSENPFVSGIKEVVATWELSEQREYENTFRQLAGRGLNYEACILQAYHAVIARKKQRIRDARQHEKRHKHIAD